MRISPISSNSSSANLKISRKTAFKENLNTYKIKARNKYKEEHGIGIKNGYNKNGIIGAVTGFCKSAILGGNRAANKYAEEEVERAFNVMNTTIKELQNCVSADRELNAHKEEQYKQALINADNINHKQKECPGRLCWREFCWVWCESWNRRWPGRPTPDY